MPCDATTLVDNAKCIACGIPPGMQLPVLINLLCQIQQNGNLGNCPPDMLVRWTPTSFDMADTMGFSLNGNVPGGPTTITFLQTTSLFGYLVNGLTTLTAISFPNLASVDPAASVSGSLILTTLPALTSVSLPLLANVGNQLRIENTIVPSLSFPKLANVTGAITIDDNHVSASLSCPVLATVGGNFDSDDCRLTSVSLPLLATVGGLLNLGNNNTTAATGNALTSLALPALTTVGSFQANKMLLTTFTAPLLTSATGGFSVTDNKFVSLSLPGLLSCQTLDISKNLLTSINFAGLADAVNINFSNNSLVTVSFPSNAEVVSFVGDNNTGLTSIGTIALFDGSTVSLKACALTAATVNAILAAGVAAGMASGLIDTSGGTSAAPSGQGIVDKATLQANGVTVNTN